MYFHANLYANGLNIEIPKAKERSKGWPQQETKWFSYAVTARIANALQTTTELRFSVVKNKKKTNFVYLQLRKREVNEFQKSLLEL